MVNLFAERVLAVLRSSFLYLTEAVSREFVSEAVLHHIFAIALACCHIL